MVLAAGRSERFGSPKPLIPWGDLTLVAHQVRTLASLDEVAEVIVVTGHRAEDVRAALNGLRARTVHNPDYAQGRATSVARAARALPEDCDGVLLVSVDQPLHPDALADLVAGWRAAPGDIVRPLHEGKHGHPVIFPGDLRAELAAVDDATEGPRAVVRRHADRLRDAPTTYPHVLLNLNTRAAYDAARAMFGLSDSDAPPASGA
ncbi:MAG: nucleotidyltransferase family protein [Chloroflexi bacterium]|nr:nucleotidyltransferase family protein [Chloroflexota bacterium]